MTILNNWVRKRFSRFPNLTMESDEKTHTGSLILKDDDGSEKAKMEYFCVGDGMLFQSFSINADSIPVDALQCFAEKPHIRINYCIKGKCDVEFNDHEKTYISGGDMTLNCGQKVRSLSFPENSYHGIEIYIFVYSNWANRTRDFESSKSTPELLYEKYKNNDHTTIFEPSHEVDEVMQTLIKCFSNPRCHRLLSIKVMELLLLLTEDGMKLMDSDRKYFTNAQIEIAKQVNKIVSEDLSRRYSAKELAQRFGVSETSLKNYFRGVYGYGYHEFQNTLRMETAAELLETTNMKVVEISMRVGFKSQTKFSNSFKQYFEMSPLEYRRKTRLRNIH